MFEILAFKILSEKIKTISKKFSLKYLQKKLFVVWLTPTGYQKNSVEIRTQKKSQSTNQQKYSRIR